jgi:hypothetical protein
MVDWSQVNKKGLPDFAALKGLCHPETPEVPAQVSDDLPPDGRSTPRIHGPLEFVSASCFEQDTRHIDPNGRIGWDTCLDLLDGHIGGTLREHLVLDRNCEPIAAESLQLGLILQRQRQEGEPRPVSFDPLHPAHITWHGGGAAVRVHYERQVLSRLQGFREA